MKYTTQVPAFAALAMSAFAHAGDTPETATPIVLGTDSITVNGSLAAANGANLELGSGCSNHTGVGADVFYSFSLDADAYVTLDLCNSNFDTDLTIHDASDPSIVVACDGDTAFENNFFCGFYTSIILNELLPAGDYIIRIGSYQGAESGDFSMVAQACIPPINDDPSSALPITFGESTLGNINLCSNNEQDWSGTTGCGDYFDGNGRDVFYSFSLKIPTQVSATLCGSGFDTDLSIHSADTLEIVAGACDDDSCGGPFYESQFEDVLLLAGDYIVRVGSYGSDTGDFTLLVDTEIVDPCEGVVLANDFPVLDESTLEYSVATTISIGETVLGSTACANYESDFSTSGCDLGFGGAGKDVFYSMTLLEESVVTLDLCGSDFDTDLSIYDTQLATTLACSGDICGDGGLQSRILNLTLQEGTYIIRVGGYSGSTPENSASGDFVLTASLGTSACVPSNDLAENALPITPGTSISGTNECANEEQQFLDCSDLNFSGYGPDVFYTLELQERSDVFMTTCFGLMDTDLSIHGEDGAIVSCDGDDASILCYPYTSALSATLDAGIWLVRVGGYDGEVGNFTLDVTVEADVCDGQVPSNDLIENALPITPGTQIVGTNFCAGEEATFVCDDDVNFDGDGADVFYSLELQEDALVIMTTCDSTDLDTDLSIHDVSGAIIACDGDSGDDVAEDGCLEYSSRIETNLAAGNYIVRVGGYDGETGNFALDVTVDGGTEPVPACPEDVDGNGSVEFSDILAVLSAYGTDDAAADVDEDGIVGFADILLLLSAWGPC